MLVDPQPDRTGFLAPRGRLVSTFVERNADTSPTGEQNHGRSFWQRWRPVNWGISTRSAAVSACVVLVAVLAAGVGLVFVLYQSLLRGIDDAATGRVHDIVEALDFDTAPELDAS